MLQPLHAGSRMAGMWSKMQMLFSSTGAFSNTNISISIGIGIGISISISIIII